MTRSVVELLPQMIQQNGHPAKELRMDSQGRSNVTAEDSINSLHSMLYAKSLETTRTEACGSSTASTASTANAMPALGSRVMYLGPTGAITVGIVCFAGETKFAQGLWLGICLDNPSGKNDGTVKGEMYFTCPPNHGMFIRPQAVIETVPPQTQEAAQQSHQLCRMDSMTDVDGPDALDADFGLEDAQLLKATGFDVVEQMKRIESDAMRQATLERIQAELEKERRLSSERAREVEKLRSEVEELKQDVNSLSWSRLMAISMSSLCCCTRASVPNAAAASSQFPAAAEKHVRFQSSG